MLPDAEYLGLVGPGQGFSGIVGTLDSVSDSAIELEGWRVDPAALGVPVGQGAGQFGRGSRFFTEQLRLTSVKVSQRVRFFRGRMPRQHSTEENAKAILVDLRVCCKQRSGQSASRGERESGIQQK